MSPRYKRILLKLSGEALMGENDYGIDAKILRFISTEVRSVHDIGVQVGIVIGGGNIFRGVAAEEQGIDRVSGDYMGMLATVINSIALQNALEMSGMQTRLLTAIKMEQIAEPFIRRRAVRHLEKNRIVIFGAGTGNPYFTTDTTASLRGNEIEADVIIKATKVDGIYTADPAKYSDAVKYERVTYREVLEKQLRVMDLTAITLAQENAIPIVVYNMFDEGSLKKLVMGENIGTYVSVS